MTTRNANSYSDTPGGAVLGAEARALIFSDIDRLKRDIFSLSTAQAEGLADAKSYTDNKVDMLTGRLNSIASEVTRNATLYETMSQQFHTYVQKLDAISDSVSKFTGIEARVENQLLKFQAEQDKILPQAVYKDIPEKLSKLTERLATLEKHMWLLQLVGTAVSALIVAFGKDFIVGLLRK